MHIFDKRYDVITGNPPFMKMNANNELLEKYRENCINDESNNTSSYFLEKSILLADNVVMVMPKFLLNTCEYSKTRDYVAKLNVRSIIDFGEKGFDGVLIETICINVNTCNKASRTKVLSITLKKEINQKQSYIFDKKLPYWVIYRNNEFDELFNKMKFNIFDVFRDRQITNSNSSKIKQDIWVIKSRNINDDATKINHIDGYDQYVNIDDIKKYNVYDFLNKANVYITPNMSYKPRVCLKPLGTIVNGSVAILIPKENIKLTNKDMLFYATSEYRNFYKIARNYQTRSLNIDKTSVFFFGKLQEE